METPLMPQPPYPLHPSVATRFAQQFIDYYSLHMLNAQQAHFQDLAVSRLAGRIATGSSQNLAVGAIHDLRIPRQESTGPDVPIRVFVPEGEADAKGWPVILYYHGGGWVFGDIETENAVCTNLCVRARCVVITTDYRLAPECPFPAALHDSFETLLWTIGCGQTQLGLDLGKSAIGGSSAGANLAAVVTQRVASRAELADKIAFRIQLLVVPVTDNTATVENNPTWREFAHTAGLSADKMLWYRNHYLPDLTTRSDSEASPLLLPSEDFAMLPPAVILVGELDVIRHEGEEYARKLRDAGVATRLEVMQGMPHSFLALDAVLDEGKRAVTILCDSLSEATL